MISTPAFTVRRAAWIADAPLLQSVRRAVFIVEQGVPEELEWDADDPVATHALALTADGQPVGTGRLLQDGYIGRVAVLEDDRVAEVYLERPDRRSIAAANRSSPSIWLRQPAAPPAIGQTVNRGDRVTSASGLSKGVSIGAS